MGLDFFNDKNIPIVCDKIKAELEAIGIKYGIDFNLKNVQYSGVSFTCTLQGILNNTDAQNRIKNEARNRVDELCSKHGLDSLYGKTLTLGSGKTLILIDTDPQTEDNFILIDDNSREYRIGVEALLYKGLDLNIDCK